MKTHLLILQDPSQELTAEIARVGSLQCLASPSIALHRPTIQGSHLSGMEQAVLEKLAKSIALSCTFDPATDPEQEITQLLDRVAIAFQLVKPTREFCQYWLKLDDNLHIESVSAQLHSFANAIAEPYLAYQQHHTVSLSDLEKVRACLSRLLLAFEPGHGSWSHPYGPIHRALIFFAQGYSVNLDPIPQFLWAAGLDCLYSSKIDRKRRGARTLARRLSTFFGSEFRPYQGEGITVPINQSRRDLRLHDIGIDIFQLRNAYAHGLSIPEAWLSQTGQPPYSGYAYQLCEGTEILLRLTLLRMLENQSLFDVFRNPKNLDRYFG